MLNLELNPQAVDFLKEMLENNLENAEVYGVGAYSETSKGIMRHILSKLEDEKELPPVSLKDLI